ncbi:MAG: hypothetical protein HYR84_13925, partial [Planctomycetes bacterium]|nr:hypothetical protein [Planctomycetota bacterium]
PAMAILPKDDAFTKLQKEKLNAAISEINATYLQARAGKIHFADIGESGRRFRDAVVDLNDPKATIKVVNAFVELMAHAQKDAEASFSAGRLDPERAHRIRYYYLDAQILQMRLKKQLAK